MRYRKYGGFQIQLKSVSSSGHALFEYPTNTFKSIWFSGNCSLTQTAPFLKYIRTQVMDTPKIVAAKNDLQNCDRDFSIFNGYWNVFLFSFLFGVENNLFVDWPIIYLKASLWKYAITASDNDTEYKVWCCSTW